LAASQPGRGTQRQAHDVRTRDAQGLHQGGHVVGDDFRRVGRIRLLRLASPAGIERDAAELLGVVGDLEGVAGVVGGEVGNQDERLALPWTS